MGTLLSELPKCIYCNHDIIYYDTVIKDGYIKSGKSALTKKNNFSLSVCESCLTEKYPDYQNLNKSRVFNRMCKETQYAFNIPEDVYQTEKKKLVVRSLDNFIAKYGEDEGNKRWNSYRKKQSITNTFEYKQKVHGMSEDEFKSYNKSRGVTLKNMIKKYGEDGITKFEEYRAKQQITKSWDYMVKTYGIEKAKLINKSKGITLSNFQRKYGEKDGEQKYQNVIRKHHSFYSKISQKFFDAIDSYIGKHYTTYYHSKNAEYGVNLGNTYIKLDYYILELNICIEFNGSIYHADPRIFNNNSKPNPFTNKTAVEIREDDAARYALLKEKRGIDTYVMWQIDYNEKTFNPLKYINQVLNIEMHE